MIYLSSLQRKWYVKVSTLSRHGMVSTKVEVSLNILMQMVYVSFTQWKMFLDLNQAGWKLQWIGREKLCALCGLVRNMFGEWLAGERKLPGFEASKCEHIWSCNWKGLPKCHENQTKNWTRDPLVCDSCPTDRSFPSWSFFYSQLQLPRMVKIKCRCETGVEFSKVVPSLCNEGQLK